MPGMGRLAFRPLPAALLAALGWFGFWWAVFPLSSPPSVPASRHAPPRLSYLPFQPEGPGMVDGDMQAVWSPILFSLPTPYGFSRSLLQERRRPSPPLSSGLLPRLPLPRPAPGGHEPPRVRSPVRDAAAWVMTAPLPPLPPRVFPGPPPEGEAPVRLWISGDFCLADFSMHDLPVPGTDLPPRLVMDVALTVDPDGCARHVLIERGSGNPALDREVLAALYRWRMPPAGRWLRGRVHIRGLRTVYEPGGEEGTR